MWKVRHRPVPALPVEVSHLFEITGSLKERGIVHISLKITDLSYIADKFSVFRDGTYVAIDASADVTRDDIMRIMVTRKIPDIFSKQPAEIGEVVMSVQGLSVDGDIRDISFDLHRGKIFYIAGRVART